MLVPPSEAPPPSWRQIKSNNVSVLAAGLNVAFSSNRGQNLLLAGDPFDCPLRFMDNRTAHADLQTFNSLTNSNCAGYSWRWVFSPAITTEPVMVLVACGPYTPSDSLTFDPLLDLINVIVRDRPDVCILVQPCLSDASVTIRTPMFVRWL